MLLLNWTERLKELIADIEDTGGDPCQKLTPAAILVSELRGYFLSQIVELSTAGKTGEVGWGNPVDRIRGYFTEQITEGFFDDGVRLCIVELAQFGVTETNKVKTILQKVVRQIVAGFLRVREDALSKDPDDLLVQHLVEVWESFGSETSRLYDFARQRLLISWDFDHRYWRSTTLGKALLGFSPLQSLCFLLTIDLMNSTGVYDFRYMSRDLLNSVFQQSPPPHVIPLHFTTLEELGVITRGRPFDWDSYQTTTVGKLALKRVLSSPNPMIDFIEMLAGAEQEGIAISSFYEEAEKLRRNLLKSSIIDQSTRDSILSAISLYENKRYIDSARILYPSIEAIANSMLLTSGENPHDNKAFPGLTKKLAILDEKRLIQSDLAKSLDITTARNKTLHGEFTPSEDEYAMPLCFTAFFYLRRMTEGYNARQLLK